MEIAKSALMVPPNYESKLQRDCVTHKHVKIKYRPGLDRLNEPKWEHKDGTNKFENRFDCKTQNPKG